MPDVKIGRKTDTKGICTDQNKANADTETTTSETDSGWKSPCKLKQEVQTIIDIMGPALSPNFNYNTSSEADNEESIFSNSKFSSEKYKKDCDCNDESEKTDTADLLSKEELNMSTAADLNTTTISATMEDLTDSNVNFPYVENVCPTNQYICPPPLMPANICVNSECFCPQVASILHSKSFQPGHPVKNSYKYETPVPRVSGIESNINEKLKVWTQKPACSTTSTRPYSSLSAKQASVSSRDEADARIKRVVFELVEKLPKNKENCNIVCEPVEPDTLKTKKNVKNERLQTRADLKCFCEKEFSPGSRKSIKPIEKTMYCDSEGKTRVDVYYFDHGSFNHYQTTDTPPLVTTEEVADKTEKYTTRFWAEMFGTIHIGFSFVTSFILQFLRFLLYSICRPLTIGLMQLGSDYFFKPFLATLFNSIIQPILVFVYNIISSIRDICDPIAEGIGYFLRELAILVRTFRIVEINTENCKCKTDCKCEKSKKIKNICQI